MTVIFVLIIFLIPNFPNRPNNAFVSTRMGKHSDFKIPLDVKQTAREIAKNSTINNKNLHKYFSGTANALGRVQTALEMIRLGNKLRGAVTGTIKNGLDSIANGEKSDIPYITQSSSTPLGRNEAVYCKTFTHLGRRTSSIIKNIAKGPFVEKETKATSLSSEDYQAHFERKNLILESGFNQKMFSFLAEDTYFSVHDFMELLEVEKRFKSDLTDENKGMRNIYGCILKTYNQLKIKNLLNPYTCHIKIHLVKITDIRTDVRSLLQEITHNTSQQSTENTGRIPKELQYTSPEVNDLNNTFSINFLTNLSCSLNLSSRFTQKAKIVKTWTRTLPAGSIWEFNLTTHLGRGININTLWDLSQSDEERIINLNKLKDDLTALIQAEDKRVAGIKLVRERVNNLRANLDNEFLRKANEHPIGYTMILEVVGDRRATIQRRADKDLFSGYSPTKLQIEFETNLTYLTNQEKEDELMVYKRPRQEKDFEEGSRLENLFCPGREIKFNVPIENIGEKKAFALLEDGSIFASADIPSVIRDLKTSFESFGFNTTDTSYEEYEVNPADAPPGEEGLPPSPEPASDPDDPNKPSSL